MTKNMIQHIKEGMEADRELYKRLQEKMVEYIRLLPNKRDRDRATRCALNTLKMNDKKDLFSDLSPEDYATRVNSILAYDAPIVTAVDRLVQMATGFLDEGKVSDLTRTIKVLSVNDGMKKPQSSKAKNRKQQKQKKTTNRVAKERLVSTLPPSVEDAPMILPSEGPWQTKPLKVAHSPFTYHRRVSRWFDPEQDPFVDDPLYAGQALSAHAQAWIRVRHAFGFVTDQFAKQCGIVHEDKNGKTLVLVGEISMHGETERGIFVWAFGKGKNEEVCHHRYFSKKTDNEIVNEYAQRGFYQLDIALEEHNPQEAPIQKPVKNRKLFEDESAVDQEKGSAYKTVITDPKHSAIITLCRLDD
jgi:hypothetical protein